MAWACAWREQKWYGAGVARRTQWRRGTTLHLCDDTGRVSRLPSGVSLRTNVFRMFIAFLALRSLVFALPYPLGGGYNAGVHPHATPFFFFREERAEGDILQSTSFTATTLALCHLCPRPLYRAEASSVSSYCRGWTVKSCIYVALPSSSRKTVCHTEKSG